MEKTITTPEFERRMAALCLGGLGPAMPRKRRDRHILLKSVALLLGHGREYTEAALNDVLKSWLEAVGRGVRIDHVSLRRYLIDEGYVTRDSAGRVYEVCTSDAVPGLFEPELNGVDPLVAVREARAEQKERRRRWAGRTGRQPN